MKNSQRIMPENALEVLTAIAHKAIDSALTATDLNEAEHHLKYAGKAVDFANEYLSMPDSIASGLRNNVDEVRKTEAYRELVQPVLVDSELVGATRSYTGYPDQDRHRPLEPENAQAAM